MISHNELSHLYMGKEEWQKEEWKKREQYPYEGNENKLDKPVK